MKLGSIVYIYNSFGGRSYGIVVFIGITTIQVRKFLIHDGGYIVHRLWSYEFSEVNEL